MKYLTSCFLLAAGLLAGPLPAQQCNGRVARTTPTGRFVLHADGTATDRRTGLQWRRCAEGQRWAGGTCRGEPATYTWDEAVRRFGKPDAQGWRLPGLKELASIVELACWNPAINLQVFPNTPASDFWSASLDASVSFNAWFLNFNLGDDNRSFRYYALHVRLVRAGQ